MRLYLAGPMRGYPRYNFDTFADAAAILRGWGFDVVSPAEMDLALGFDPDSADPLPDGFVEHAMRRDVEAILTVDCIVVLPGWEKSSGVEVELTVARALGLPVYRYTADSPGTARCESLDDEEAFLPVPPGGFVDPDLLYVVGERRVVNATTGGAKGQKLARFDLLPADALRQVAEHYGKGAAKYEDRNWERGYDWSLSFSAMQRHAWQWWNGEDVDEETGSSHLAAVIFHALALLTFDKTHPELDDRPACVVEGVA